MHLLCSSEEILLCKWEKPDLDLLKDKAWFLKPGFITKGLLELSEGNARDRDLLVVCSDWLTKNVP